MGDLDESAARRSETSLMEGRLSGLAKRSDLNPDQRIGVCLAQKVLVERSRELEARREYTKPADVLPDGLREQIEAVLRVSVNDDQWERIQRRFRSAGPEGDE